MVFLGNIKLDLVLAINVHFGHLKL